MLVGGVVLGWRSGRVGFRCERVQEWRGGPRVKVQVGLVNVGHDRGVCVKLILSSIFDNLSMSSLNCSTLLFTFVSVSLLDSDVLRFGCIAYPLLLLFLLLLFSFRRFVGESIRLYSFVMCCRFLIGVVVASGRPRTVRCC